MPGPRSRSAGKRWRTTAPATPVDPYASRPTLRISTLYGTAWRTGTATATVPVANMLKFGRLDQFYRSASDQLPTVVSHRVIDPARVRCERWREGSVAGGWLWLLAMPSGQLMVGLTLDVDCHHLQAVNLLEDCYYLDVAVEGTDVAALASAEARAHGVRVEEESFAPERHQVVFSRMIDVDDPEDLVQRLVYRANLPYRPDFSTISYPAELNRRPNTIGAVGPYVSVLCGHQDYVENAAFASASQAVASSVRLREIRNAVYHDLRRFRMVEGTRGDTRTRRRALEQIANDLTRLELDLSVSVEAPADLEVLVPSLRVVEYHHEVYSAIGIKELAGTVSRMLRRLESTGRTELTSVQSIERRADEDRRLRWAVAIGFVSVVAIPISLALAFFGANAAQVDAQRSMLDPAYAWMYASVSLLVLTATLLALALYAHQRRRYRSYLVEAEPDRGQAVIPDQREAVADNSWRTGAHG